MKTSETKYLPRDRAWVIKNNKPLAVTIYCVTIMPEYGALGKLRSFYTVWPYPSLFAVTHSGCIIYKEDELFETKADLIASL